MSAADVHAYGAFQRSAVTFVAMRWGGGAYPGHWHVFTARQGADSNKADWDADLLRMSSQAVIDDFGNLVRVPA